MYPELRHDVRRYSCLVGLSPSLFYNHKTSRNNCCGSLTSQGLAAFIGKMHMHLLMWKKSEVTYTGFVAALLTGSNKVYSTATSRLLSDFHSSARCRCRSSEDHPVCKSPYTSIYFQKISRLSIANPQCFHLLPALLSCLVIGLYTSLSQNSWNSSKRMA